jgi:hypothetical protein
MRRRPVEKATGFASSAEAGVSQNGVLRSAGAQMRRRQHGQTAMPIRAAWCCKIRRRCPSGTERPRSQRMTTSKLNRLNLYAIPTQKSLDRFKDQIRALTQRKILYGWVS